MPTVRSPSGESPRTPLKRLARVVANKGMTRKEAVGQLMDMGYRGKELLPFYDALVEEVNALPPTQDEGEEDRRKALIEAANRKIVELIQQK